MLRLIACCFPQVPVNPAQTTVSAWLWTKTDHWFTLKRGRIQLFSQLYWKSKIVLKLLSTAKMWIKSVFVYNIRNNLSYPTKWTKYVWSGRGANIVSYCIPLEGIKRVTKRPSSIICNGLGINFYCASILIHTVDINIDNNVLVCPFGAHLWCRVTIHIPAKEI